MVPPSLRLALRFRGLALSAALALVSAPALAEPPPSLSPGLRAPGFGDLELQVKGETLSAFALERAGACRFEPGRRVLEGQFEGGVFVGRVMLCQTGPACEAERSVPVLAFYSAAQGTLSSVVRLDAGCTSPALQGGRLVLEPLTQLPAEGRKELAERRRQAERNKQRARVVLTEAAKHLQGQRFAQAAALFDVALSYYPENFAALQGLGVAEFEQGHTAAAIAMYERSLALAPDKDTYFNLAVAYARLKNRERALENLQRAATAGFDAPNFMQGDKDLTALLGGDPIFLTLLEKVRARHEAQAGGRGTP